MINTMDLQTLNKAVHTARKSGDIVAYDIALDAYSKALEQWATEGAEIANEARHELSKDPALRRMFGEK
jgi:hypothetical protein